MIDITRERTLQEKIYAHMRGILDCTQKLDKIAVFNQNFYRESSELAIDFQYGSNTVGGKYKDSLDISPHFSKHIMPLIVFEYQNFYQNMMEKYKLELHAMLTQEIKERDEQTKYVKEEGTEAPESERSS